MSPLPLDYLHKIYAGVLGKLIGVYLGRPFENWTYQEILQKLGPIDYYVHERCGVPLVVIDDDVSGTFAFARALEEHGVKADLSSEEIGKTWLNQVIEKRTIFWWGGHGISTEHTTFNNLKKGIKPPETGSIATNGKTLAEQIGAQIFIDGWALVAPANPSLAAKLARAAARVSHDGVAVDAAILWAAMEAEAFVSKDPNHLLDTGLSFIPSGSSLHKLVVDIRNWVKEDKDWRKTRQRIEDDYGYDKYGGICHMIPNHGIMIMALLYGSSDFSTAMHIINTSGWDTDCNSGNVGCLVAIMNGLGSFEKHKGLDWRGPLADRALISSADGGYSINDAARITYDLANYARKLAGEQPLAPPKNGARWHFSLPGSVQGFQTTAPSDAVKVQQGEDNGVPALGIHADGTSTPTDTIEILTQTFTPADVLAVKRDYEMMACPLVWPGQILTAVISSSNTSDNPSVSLRLKAYDTNDQLTTIDSPPLTCQNQTPGKLEWTIPQNLQNKPIQQLGLAITPTKGTIWLHSIAVSGTPTLSLSRPALAESEPGGSFWQHMWVSSVHKAHARMGPSFYLAQSHGGQGPPPISTRNPDLVPFASEGLFYTGTREWKDYHVTVSDFMVHLGVYHGVIVRVQGLNRWYAAVFRKLEGKGWLYIVQAKDESRIVLRRAQFAWEVDAKYEVEISVKGEKICAKVGDVELKGEGADEYEGGGVGFLVGEGCVSAECLNVSPA